MKFEQTTDRLILRILPADYAYQVLQFYKNNAGIFEQYEPFIDENFYTLEHQKHILTYEYGEILKRDIPKFMLELSNILKESNKSFREYISVKNDDFKELVEKYNS